HVWLDPVLMLALHDRVAAVVADILAVQEASNGQRAGAASASGLGDRAASAAAGRAGIVAIDRDFRAMAASARRKSFVAGHEAFNWLARRYGLHVTALEGLAAGEPLPGDIKQALDAVRREHLTTVFVEPQLSQAASRRIAEATGAKVAVLDPLGDGD